MKSKSIILLLMLLVSVLSVSATFTITRNSPRAYSIENSTTVIFNTTAVDSGGSTTMTCGVYNRSNRTGEYSLGKTYNATNNTSTDNSLNVTFDDELRVWWFISCWDQVSEFTTGLEAQTTPAINTIVNLANDANGVTGVSALVNYTQDETNEAVDGTPASTSFALNGNGSVTVVSGAEINRSTDSSVNESVTLPLNATSINLAGNGTVIEVTSAWVNRTGDNFSVLTSGEYSLSEGIVTLINASIQLNASLWNYKYLSWNAYTNYSLASGIVTSGTLYENNNTRWNYTHLNESIILTADNYNITGGFVYMNTSTYEGDTSMWNYSYPLTDFLGQENTSVRILDVDDYYYEFLTIWVPIRLAPQAQGTCDSTSAGTIYYDSTANVHYGCNSTTWKAMY